MDRKLRGLVRTREDRDMRLRLCEDRNKTKEGKKGFRREYKERSERLKQTCLMEPKRNVPNRNPAVELLTQQDMSQITEKYLTSGSGE